MNDFSTMQMLFKTNGMGIPSNSMSQKTNQTTNQLK